MPTIHKIDGSRYYQCDDIRGKYKHLTKYSSAKVFVSKHAIPDHMWIHARLRDGQWIRSTNYSPKVDKIMLRVRHVDKYMMPEEDDEEDEDENEDESEHEHPRLPQEVILDEDEVFRDCDGNELKIRVVGERKSTKCYFNVGDVSRCFGLKRLCETITHCNTGYEENVHYRVFYVSSDEASVIYGSSRGYATANVTHYLTYIGLIRALFTCHNKTANTFLTWASDTLFTAHLGTKTQKRELARALLGVTPAAIKDMCAVNAGIIACVYLYSLGTVKQLRKSMGIGKEYSDDQIVYKYGCTNDLARRTREHATKYGALRGAHLELVYYGRIDTQHAFKAEAEIAAVFASHDLMFTYQGSKEIAIAPLSKLPALKKAYDAYTEIYQGRVKELDTAIEKVRSEMVTMEMSYQLKLKDAELELNAVKMELKDAKHEAEILRLRLEIAAK